MENQRNTQHPYLHPGYANTIIVRSAFYTHICLLSLTAFLLQKLLIYSFYIINYNFRYHVKA